ncbi:MAG: AAA family ATPase [bacterium]|nr:AAA family ATPase [bacterium]
MWATKEVKEILSQTMEKARDERFQYVTPELLLWVMSTFRSFSAAFESCGGDIGLLQKELWQYLDGSIPRIPEDGDLEKQELSQGFIQILNESQQCMENCGKDRVETGHLIHALYTLEESYALYYIEKQGVERMDILAAISKDTQEEFAGGGVGPQNGAEAAPQKERWRQFVTCLNEQLEGTNPLIGREWELERTMQILCRKGKNNPLHLGEPGVGKTAIAYGLAALLEKGEVPKPLEGAKIYAVDMGTMLAGTQYRGDFEKRFKEVMDGLCSQEKPIVYLDEIHNIVGAGAVNGGSFDISNMLKPYLSEGKVRFMGATTYEEYKKYFEKSKSLVRRFQNVEISEPSEEETIRILKGLQKRYEKFHGVSYAKGVLEYAVHMSANYIHERYLPDKAIDLIDEAGAYRRMHPLSQKRQTIGKDVIDMLLSSICKIPENVVESDETEKLRTLKTRLSSQVFGQEEAIVQSVNAIKFSRAGLLEEGKPLASLLFVGPTGVGKTEVARTLAKELGVKLIRFDMSEYEEKHAVAKLIGAPAGYVGYEEGGLLTEEIRKNPHAVLLLDEIEKAHPDIYHILLQVMDYATLTDNQGRKADFRNIILIMTSNAGASQIGKEQIGFGDRTVCADVILDEVKKTFQPEFRNRLTKIVVFRGMDAAMARRVTEKKLRELSEKLSRKQIAFSVTEDAMTYLLEKGISKEYGAREIERVISGEVKPLLVDEILFGKLKKGGNCKIDCKDGALFAVFEKTAGQKASRDKTSRKETVQKEIKQKETAQKAEKRKKTAQKEAKQKEAVQEQTEQK